MDQRKKSYAQFAKSFTKMNAPVMHMLKMFMGWMANEFDHLTEIQISFKKYMRAFSDAIE